MEFHEEAQCFVCHKSSFDLQKNGQRIKICSRCSVAYYCSPKCQMEDHPRHKKICYKFVGKHRKEADNLERLMKIKYPSLQAVGFEGTASVLLSMAEQFHFEISEFTVAKRSIILGMYTVASLQNELVGTSIPSKYPYRACLEKVLKETYSTMTLCQPILTMMRFFVPLLLIKLQRYDEAYNFIKFWLATVDFRANGPGLLECEEFCLKDQDLKEDIIEALEIEYKKRPKLVDCLFYIHLVILKIMQSEKMDKEQDEHVDKYLNYVQLHYPGFFQSFVYFDPEEDEFCVPKSLVFNPPMDESFAKEMLCIFGTPLVTLVSELPRVQEKIKEFVIGTKAQKYKRNHEWKQKAESPIM